MHTAVFCFLFYSFYDILIEQLTISLIGTVHIAGGEHRSLHAMLLQQLDKSSHHTLCKEDPVRVLTGPILVASSIGVVASPYGA